MARLGFTSRGTLVEINASFAAADLKIVLGMIDPHQFQGMTGGAKGVAIGCASKDMIQHNHSLMVDPAARVGNIKDNPARLDIDEAGRIIASTWPSTSASVRPRSPWPSSLAIPKPCSPPAPP